MGTIIVTDLVHPHSSNLTMYGFTGLYVWLTSWIGLVENIHPLKCARWRRGIWWVLVTSWKDNAGYMLVTREAMVIEDGSDGISQIHHPQAHHFL